MRRCLRERLLWSSLTHGCWSRRLRRALPFIEPASTATVETLDGGFLSRLCPCARRVLASTAGAACGRYSLITDDFVDAYEVQPERFQAVARHTDDFYLPNRAPNHCLVVPLTVPLRRVL